MASGASCTALIFVLFSISAAASVVFAGSDDKKGVTYDARSFIINGKRELLFSGSVHYPRSTPEYNFEGRYDLVKFIKLIQQKKMYVTLRIGPFIQAEWNHGGLPVWLRDVENIPFRTNNPPFKEYFGVMNGAGEEELPLPINNE